MPDITMCKGTNCNRKDNCYRHTATPNTGHQAYFVHAPVNNQECQYYWDNTTELTQALNSSEKDNG